MKFGDITFLGSNPDQDLSYRLSENVGPDANLNRSIAHIAGVVASIFWSRSYVERKIKTILLLIYEFLSGL